VVGPVRRSGFARGEGGVGEQNLARAGEGVCVVVCVCVCVGGGGGVCGVGLCVCARVCGCGWVAWVEDSFGD